MTTTTNPTTTDSCTDVRAERADRLPRLRSSTRRPAIRRRGAMALAALAVVASFGVSSAATPTEAAAMPPTLFQAICGLAGGSWGAFHLKNGTTVEICTFSDGTHWSIGY